MSIIRVPAFGGGVVTSGAPDTRAIGDVLAADGYDITLRGALVAASDIANFRPLYDKSAVPTFWERIFFFGSYNGENAYAVGQGDWYDGAATTYPAYLLGRFVRYDDGLIVALLDGGPFTADSLTSPAALGNPLAPIGSGVIVTSALIPGTFPLQTAAPQVAPYPEYGVLLVNVGAREGFPPRVAPGLYAILVSRTSTSGSVSLGIPYPIVKFMSLGTGPLNPEGTYIAPFPSQQLYPKGIVAYNNHVFAWGFDASNNDTGDGPARVMFSNLGDPLMWGNDNQGDVGVEREFTDSDAIVLGGAGEVIRAAIVWNGRLWFFTNQQGHYIAGYGRDSFITDGATPVLRSQNVVGPMAVIEGPDRRLYGIGDEGLWRTQDGTLYEQLADRVRDFAGRSLGYWDLLWTNTDAAAYDYPGRTNKDLVWMAVDHEREQVLIGIPFCDATTGEGQGTDTVIIKYNTRTDGFTRQVFADTLLTAAGYLRSEGQFAPTQFMGLQPVDGSDSRWTVQTYGTVASAELPDPLPSATFGLYAPFGPDGEGVVRQVMAVLAWDDAANPALAFDVTITIDGVAISTFTLYLNTTAPGGAATGDYWVDLSQTNTSLGNGTAAGDIAARGGYLLKVRRSDGSWMVRPGLGGTMARLTVPMPVERMTGSRYAVTLACTAAGARFTVEGLAFDVGGGVPVA